MEPSLFLDYLYVHIDGMIVPVIDYYSYLERYMFELFLCGIQFIEKKLGIEKKTKEFEHQIA